LPVLLDGGCGEKEVSEKEWDEKSWLLQGQTRTRETQTRQFPSINLMVIWENISVPHDNPAPKKRTPVWIVRKEDILVEN
jgi:hypothetical protein